MSILTTFGLIAGGATFGFFMAAMMAGNKIAAMQRQLSEATDHLRQVSRRLRIFGIDYLPGEAFLARQRHDHIDA
ncbi:hypothetical protein FHW96_000260 [Novosphingobium sp. SG751A]|uniref:hypothetical protein n=1 Tax=Novosphingobium sp. SG751A TaxID=2587000 RepID=UPI001552E418|nr:hypothetical protein [Novosphingobium sp. SG751A]NOW44133.1 hypothetical protein [Novosphingobium sp. SG751A]